MSRLTQKFAILAICMSSISMAQANEKPELPETGVTPVIEFWYLNGYTPDYPEVIILADGRMQVMSPEGPLRTELSKTQVRDLLHQLLNVDGLKSTDTATMKEQILRSATQTGLRSEFEGAGETVIRIKTAKETREIRCHAVGIMAVRFPELKSVSAMANAQRRLENVRAVATVGGSDQADEIASMAARAVQDKYSVDVPVSAEHLSMVRALPDGSRYCQFLVASDEGDRSQPLQMISITETPGHHPQVSIIGGPVVR